MSQVFQQYILRQQIARKKTSVLYLAHSIDHEDDFCVIKAYDTLDLHDEDEQQQFLQELLTIHEIEHPHILSPLNGGIERGYPYIVSPYMPAGSLYERFQDGAYATLPWQEVLGIVGTIGEALAYAHAQGCVHGDLKPENIVFDAADEPLLTDFRLRSIEAQFKHSTHVHQLLNARTACYMAPEQFTRRADERSDQYGLACLAYELLAGRPPFQAASLSTWRSLHENEEPPALDQLVPTLPTDLVAALHRALAKDPARRYASMAAFVAALTTASAAIPVDIPETPADKGFSWTGPEESVFAEEAIEPEEAVVAAEAVESALEPTASAEPAVITLEPAVIAQTGAIEPGSASAAQSVGIAPEQTIAVRQIKRTAEREPVAVVQEPPARRVLTKATGPLLWLLAALAGIALLLLVFQGQLPRYIAEGRSLVTFSPPPTVAPTAGPRVYAATPTAVHHNQVPTSVVPVATPMPTATPGNSSHDQSHQHRPGSTPTPTPTVTPTPTATAVPGQVPTSVVPVALPTATPTVAPTATATPEPTVTPTPTPPTDPTPPPWWPGHRKGWWWWGW